MRCVSQTTEISWLVLGTWLLYTIVNVQKQDHKTFCQEYQLGTSCHVYEEV